jgi:glycosyltransferase involved in cell wall biosynthesis
MSTALPITPLILTYNEESNIGRTLDSLEWAERIVVVDSGSSDATETIARSYQNVSWYVRKFDQHNRQWRYGVEETSIDTKYILALDADMSPTGGFINELTTSFLSGDFSGGIIPFEYRIAGQPLPGSLCPAQLRLFDTTKAQINQHGHTQVFGVQGPIYTFKEKIIHDDRKPLEQWIQSQLNYSLLEQQRINIDPTSSLKNRLRLLGIMPVIVGCYAYLRAGGPFGGKTALRYAYERTTFECLLAMRLVSEKPAVPDKD